MKKIVLGFALIASISSIRAQTKIAAGKKLQVEVESKSSNTVSFGGNDMETILNGKNYTDFEVKSVTGNTVVLTATTKRITGFISMMGQEQKFDSDDKATTSNPMLADAFKALNKPEDITLNNGKPNSKLKIAGSTDATNADFAAKLFLTVDATNLKEGFKWTNELTMDDGSKDMSIYTITKISPSEIEVTGSSSLKSLGTMQQMGMDIQRNLTGTNASVRVYDALTKLLKAEASKIEMTGTVQAMGNDVPLTAKATITATVK